tara:strand:- start:2231 stop:3451 length:1221 start_codon:yes stop_codon:yes gene_type:complete
MGFASFIFVFCGNLVSGSVDCDNKKVLTLWHSYTGVQYEVLRNLLNEYNSTEAIDACLEEKFRNVWNIEAFILGTSSLKSPPDLLIAPHISLLTSDNLSSYETANGLDFNKNFAAEVLKAFEREGKLFALPINLDVAALIYNRNLIKMKPQTLGDLEKSMLEISTPQKGLFGISYEYDELLFHSIFLNGPGRAAYDPINQKWNIATESNINSYNKILGWRDSLRVLHPNAEHASVVSAFNSNKVAFAIVSSQYFYDSDEKESTLISESVNYDFSLLPYSDKGSRLMPWSFIEGIYITKQSADYKASQQFAVWLTSEHTQVKFFELPTYVSANRKLYERQLVELNKYQEGFYNQAKYSTPIPTQKWFRAVLNNLQWSTKRIFGNNEDPIEVLLDAENKIKEKPYRGI